MKRLLALPALMALAGCVTLEQPDEPIDINLNVKIEQEVLVRLDREVDALISDNPDAFPVADEAENPE